MKAKAAAAPAQAPSVAAAPAPPAVAKSGNGELSAQERDKLLGELKDAQSRLKSFQGESPLIFPSVDANAIASVVADWTGIPVGRMVKNEIEQVLSLADVEALFASYLDRSEAALAHA